MLNAHRRLEYGADDVPEPRRMHSLQVPGEGERDLFQGDGPHRATSRRHIPRIARDQQTASATEASGQAIRARAMGCMWSPECCMSLGNLRAQTEYVVTYRKAIPSPP